MKATGWDLHSYIPHARFPLTSDRYQTGGYGHLWIMRILASMKENLSNRPREIHPQKNVALHPGFDIRGNSFNIKLGDHGRILGGFEQLTDARVEALNL